MEEHHPDASLDRLVFFSDAVFAIAITLLIIDVRVPRLPLGATDADWLRALLDLVPSLLGFLLSFLVIGAFWASHNKTMSLLGRFHQRLIWPNLFLLMAVAFMPFPTALVSSGSLAHVPFIVYGAALMTVAVLKSRLTAIALRPDLIAHDVPAATVTLERRRLWIMPIATTTTFLLAFVVPGYSTLAMLLLPALRRLPYFRSVKPKPSLPA